MFPLIFLALGYAVFFFIFNKKEILKVTKSLKVDSSFFGKKEKAPKKTVENFEEIEGMEEPEAKAFEPLKEKPEPPSSLERRYIGPDFKPIENPPTSIVYENTVNPNWENLLIKEFFDGDRPDGNIEIKKLDSFVYIKGNNGLYVEKVAVNVIAPKEMAGTFYAYVNSGTGEIMHAWEGEEETPSDEISQPSDDSSPAEIEDTAMEIPESTIEEGVEFTEEEVGTLPSEDTFYPDYN
ncbi:MAG: hypothetical protein ACHQYQ_03420 [Bacteriovoracales bacterium]